MMGNSDDVFGQIHIKLSKRKNKITMNAKKNKRLNEKNGKIVFQKDNKEN